jgi:hypothetical protein
MYNNKTISFKKNNKQNLGGDIFISGEREWLG